ncbi:MAG: hypothetical protein QW416_01270 [Candidatus Nitrosocaldaceae archaeon]
MESVIEREDKRSEKENIEDLTSKVFMMVVGRGKQGILQSELWKALSLTSRDGSRVAMRLEKRALVSRERVLENGRWTYRLVALRLPADTRCIEGAPCLICANEHICNQDSNITSATCKEIERWLLNEYNNRHVNNETNRS